MKSWNDYETTEEAFEALRIMRGGEPPADELAKKAGLRFGRCGLEVSVYADARDEGLIAVLQMDEPNRYRLRMMSHEDVFYSDELEAILAKMKELQG